MEILGHIVPPTDTTHARFQGLACPLQALWNYWLAMHATYKTSMPKALSAPYTFSIAYDKCVVNRYAAYHSSITAKTSTIVELIERPSQDVDEEFAVTKQLLNDYPPERLYVLHLAITQRPTTRHEDAEFQRVFPRICHTTGGDADRQGNMSEKFEESGTVWGLNWESTSIYDGDVKSLGLVSLCDDEGRWKRIGICMWIDLPHEGHRLKDWCRDMH